jgi:hypothetical protein
MASFVEILKQIGTYGPRFITDLSAVISGPRRFSERYPYDKPSALSDALVFYAICVGISFVFDAPFSGKSEIVMPFVEKLVIFTLCILYTAAACKLAFHWVGGRAPFRQHLIVTLYTSGPFGILFSLVATACKGIVKAQAPTSYPIFQRSMDDLYTGKPLNLITLQPLLRPTPVLIAFLIVVSVNILACVWLYACWGCYRQINLVGRTRSFVACFIVVPLVYPMAYIFTWALRGLGLVLF